MPKFLRSLFGQVLLALAAGILIGFAAPEFAVKLKPLGDGFIKLIKMLIPLIVFCVVVHGIAGAGDLKRVGRASRRWSTSKGSPPLPSCSGWCWPSRSSPAPA